MPTPPRQTQLEWRSPDEASWDDLPPETRADARKRLAQLLRQVAGDTRPPREAPNEA